MPTEIKRGGGGWQSLNIFSVETFYFWNPGNCISLTLLLHTFKLGSHITKQSSHSPLSNNVSALSELRGCKNSITTLKPAVLI